MAFSDALRHASSNEFCQNKNFRSPMVMLCPENARDSVVTGKLPVFGWVSRVHGIKLTAPGLYHAT